MGERNQKGLFFLALAETKIRIQLAKLKLHRPPPADQNKDECKRRPREEFIPVLNFTSILVRTDTLQNLFP